MYQPPEPSGVGRCLRCASSIEESEQLGGICYGCQPAEAGDQPAFPVQASEYGGHGAAFGMTLRDYFAAHTAEVSDEIGIQYAEKIVGRKMPDFAALPLDNAAFWAEYRAIMRYIEADAMLAARVKP